MPTIMSKAVKIGIIVVYTVSGFCGGFFVGKQMKDKKCYEILHNSSTRCTNCINNKLKKGEFVESKFFNPRVKKYLLTKDTIVEYKEKLYRLNISIDVSEQEEYNKAVRRYENLEATVVAKVKAEFDERRGNDFVFVPLIGDRNPPLDYRK